MSEQIESSTDESNKVAVNNQGKSSKGESDGRADISSGNAIASTVLSALSSMLIVPELEVQLVQTEAQLVQTEEQLKLAEEQVQLAGKRIKALEASLSDCQEQDCGSDSIRDPEDHELVLTGEAKPPEINPNGGPS